MNSKMKNIDKEPPELTIEQIRKEINKRHKKIREGTISDQYSFFMGKCQILEFGLKNLLKTKYHYSEEIDEKPLGYLIDQLENVKVRGDFIYILKHLKWYRNYFAHEYHANRSGLSGLNPLFARLEDRNFPKALFQVEQAIIVYDFLLENHAF